MTAPAWIGVAALGATGAILRFSVDGLVASRISRDFPFGTLIVNISGALLLGLFVGLGFSGEGAVLADTATIGSYTTFSTWMLETQRLVEDGQFAGAVVNVLFSLAAGLGAAALGRLIGRHL